MGDVFCVLKFAKFVDIVRFADLQDPVVGEYVGVVPIFAVASSKTPAYHVTQEFYPDGIETVLVSGRKRPCLYRV